MVDFWSSARFIDLIEFLLLVMRFNVGQQNGQQANQGQKCAEAEDKFNAGSIADLQFPNIALQRGDSAGGRSTDPFDGPVQHGPAEVYQCHIKVGQPPNTFSV